MKRITVILTAALLLALPALAGAKIVVGHGLAGLKLGASEAQVKAKLGRPDDIVHVTAKAEWVYGARGLVVMFGGSGKPHVVGLYTHNRSERTSGGIGVGSTKQQVLQAIPGVSCKGGGCIVFSRSAGKNDATDFSLDGSGTVTAVLVAELG